MQTISCKACKTLKGNPPNSKNIQICSLRNKHNINRNLNIKEMGNSRIFYVKCAKQTNFFKTPTELNVGEDTFQHLVYCFSFINSFFLEGELKDGWDSLKVC